MSKSQAVAQHLPYLRRYARALTGSQASGDAYVAATLEALVKEPQFLEFGRSAPRDPVPAVFHHLELASGQRDPRPGGKPAPGRAAPRPDNGQAAASVPLLFPLKGFLRKTPRGFWVSTSRACVRSSENPGASWPAQIATDVLIIEDEALIALDLESAGGEPRPPRDRYRPHPHRGDRRSRAPSRPA